MPRRRPMSRRALPLVLTFAAVALAACTGSDDAAVSTTALGTLVAPVASTTTPVATTTTTLPPTTIETTTTVAPTTTESTTTTTTIPFVTTGATVIVANASGVPGAATELTQKLRDFGFTVLDPTDAAAFDERLDVSKVYVLRGTEDAASPAAVTISRMMGNVAVAPLPVPPPMTGAFEGLADATVVVMLGKDLAGKVLPGPGPEG